MEWSIDQYHKNLTTLINRIKYYEIPIELKGLSEIQNTLYSKIIGMHKFEVDAKNITVNLSHSVSGTTPVNIRDFSISFDHEFSIDETKDFDKNDLIDKYSFDIQITGFDDNADEYFYSWHLDKNISSAEPKFTHPYYHFQGGGHKLEGKSTGEILLVDFPRLPHPPMDLFLGLHFIINNFVSSKDYPKKMDLLNDYDYQNVIVASQKLVWDIYFNSFSAQCANDDYNFKNVFPLYIH